jgi:hypothetical protein
MSGLGFRRDPAVWLRSYLRKNPDNCCDWNPTGGWLLDELGATSAPGVGTPSLGL